MSNLEPYVITELDERLVAEVHAKLWRATQPDKQRFVALCNLVSIVAAMHEKLPPEEHLEESRRSRQSLDDMLRGVPS